MNKILIVFMVGITWTMICYGQHFNPSSKLSYLLPHKLEVTYNKTSHLVFPGAIVSIDRGSPEILVQKATGVDHILKVKAASKKFEETNLNVITKDGKLYSFEVYYGNNPSYVSINGDVLTLDSTSNQPGSSKLTDTEVKYYAQRVLHGRNTLAVSDRAIGVHLDLKAMFVKRNILFCKIEIENESAIDYDADQIRFYLRDRKLSKRTISQEIELNPEYIFGNCKTVKGNRRAMFVTALPKFTIPDGKVFIIELQEKGGGRHMLLRLKNKHLRKVKPITL